MVRHKTNHMKKTITLTACIALVAFLGFNFTTTHGEHEILEVGKKAPNVAQKMKDVSGNEYSLNDLALDNGLLVVFSCNTCPFVVGRGEDSEGWEGRYNDLYTLGKRNKIGMVLVNSNEAKRDAADSFEAMVTHAKENGYKSAYVMDKNSELANAFGAKTTPHVFLFDSNMKLVYTGAIDDNVSSASEVKEKWLRAAMVNLATGNEINPATTRHMGCSIKRVK